MTRRRFNSSERITLYLSADGKCSVCGAVLAGGWEADHVIPYSRGGETSVTNGQALCVTCNREKGVKVQDGIQLRPNQSKAEAIALDKWEMSRGDLDKRKMVALIHPGGGKTLLALNIANTFYREGYTSRVIYFSPRLNLAIQIEQDWSRLRHLYRQVPRMGTIVHRENNPPLIRGEQTGYATTYASAVSQPVLHLEVARAKPTLLILDEAQQLGVTKGDNGFGTASSDIADQLMSVCEFTLIMTGTPYRSDGRPILGATYTDPDHDNTRYIEADVRSTYIDGLSNPPAHGGPYLRFFEAHLWDGRGKEQLIASRQTVDYRLSHGDPGATVKVPQEYGYWSGLVDKTIEDIREYQHVDPRYCGLIAAGNQKHAKAIEADVRRRHPTVRVLVAVSEDNEAARDNLRKFRAGGHDLLITVNMAYIGYDYKPISVITILTPYRWEGYLRQLVARGLRVMDGVPAELQTLRVNAPDDPAMADFCETMRSEAEAGVRERKKGGGGGGGNVDPELSIMLGAELLERRVKGMDPIGDLEADEASYVEQEIRSFNLGPCCNLSGVAAMLRSKGFELGNGLSNGTTPVNYDTELDTKTESEKEATARLPVLAEMRRMDARLMQAGFSGATFGFCNGKTNYQFEKSLASCSLDEIDRYLQFFRTVVKPKLERYCAEYGA